MRSMIDATHDDLLSPSAWPAINSLPAGDIVALYDTGSGDIAATGDDIARVPKRLHIAFIDQGFTHSPNRNAVVRDCESGAWSLSRAVDRNGWDAERPTLYLGFPDTVQQAYDAGWRGDVWIVAPSLMAPVQPPFVPPGIHVVAVQWRFTGTWDESAVFDNDWPQLPPIIPVRSNKKMLLVHIEGNPTVCLWNGTTMSHVTSVADEGQFKAAGIQSVMVSAAQFTAMAGSEAITL